MPLIMALTCQDAKDEVAAKTCETMLTADDLSAVRTDEFGIDTAYVSGNCLKVRVVYGGGFGSEELAKFEMHLSKAVAESNPPQRWLKLSLDDKDFAKALVRRELSYSLVSARLGGSGKLILNLQGYPKSLIYEY